MKMPLLTVTSSLLLILLISTTAAHTTQPVRIGATSYPSLAAAYAAAASNDIILTTSSLMPDNGLNINSVLAQGKIVTIKGGYTSDFSSRSELPTCLKGILNISSGTLKVDRLSICNKMNQSVSGFNPPATASYGDAAITLSATASSGLPVSFSVVSGSGSINGSLLTITGAGTIVIKASQSGNSIYNVAPDVTASVTVAKTNQFINFNRLSPVTLGSGDFSPGATASSSLPVSYSSDNSSVATIQNGMIHITGVGQATITATQAGNSNYTAAEPVQQVMVVTLTPSPIGNSGLESYWPLDGDWHDAMGKHDLTPNNPGGFSAAPNIRAWNNQAYGPTGSDTGNGAISSSFTTLPEADGITLEGWAWLPDESTGGTLLGFGGNGYDEPKLNISIGWGFIWINIGQRGDGFIAKYPRIGDTCWHHLALVLPVGFREGVPLRFYLDGKEITTLGIDNSATSLEVTSLGNQATLWGGAFRIGAFTSPNGADSSARNMKVDETRVWTRAMTPSEISTLATTQGTGALCENSPPPNWAPGPRFTPQEISQTPQLVLGVHQLTDDTVAIITDPNPWLKERIKADAGAYLTAMEANLAYVPDWYPEWQYTLATKEVIAYYRPPLLLALSGNNHFTVITDGKDVGPVIQLSLWPQSIREFRAPSFAARGGEVHIVDASEVVYYSFIKLPKALTPGTSYQITDQWGNSATFVYDEDSTVSYALKVNQTGYLPDAGEKYAYLGAWLGASGGALDLSRFEGKPFSICNEADHQAVFTGTIAFRRDESSPIPGYTADGANINLSGEKVYQLDFSVFTKPGKYYIKVPGLGRSWGFEIGQNAMGEAFYIHARGLYHQRCAPLDQAFTPWSRGDAHHPIKKAYHPTELGAYGVGYDGWGFIDDATGKFPVDDLGNFMVIDAFPVITATKSEEIVSDSSGEWHDAGDFSLDGYNHLRVVEYLTEAYLMYPANFSDNQLNIPEHDNGIPDIIDEAIWGTDLWRRLQEPDGRVAVYVEAESHPRILDPSVDTEQYYQGLATRNSSLFYAEHAARLVRALNQVGSSAATKAQLFLDSAKKAYAFAETSYDILPRISAKFTLEGKNITWIEPSSLDSDRQVKALVQLWLASGDRTYYDALNSSEMAQAFNKAVGSLYWRDFGFDFVDVALAPEKFPTGWGGTATTGIVSTATKWINWQSNDAYRKLWPTIGGDGYWGSTGWGNSGFVELLHVIPAWRLTGEERFRTGALLAVDWLHGANPQGRVNTTGLGKNYVVQPLHDPSDSDGIADPVPGITIYGYTFGIPWNGSRTVYGLFDDPSPVYDFNGSFLAQLPPPWDITGMDISAIKDVLKNKIPLWRNIITLEGSAVGWMEFDVASTVGPAAAITGCLLGPGWMPSDNLKNRRPKSEIELKDALWYQP